jgi:hypothetical protein
MDEIQMRAVDRCFSLSANILAEVCKGNRNPDHVADFLQEIKNNPNFYEVLAKKSGECPKPDITSHPRLQELLSLGWKIEPGGVSAEGALDISRFELREFLEEGESYVVGTTMRERAKKMGGLTGLDSALYLLDNQEKIPKEWRSFYIAFPGALLRGPDGRLFAPYLFWNDRRWRLSLYWLVSYWRSCDRVLRLRK